MADKPEDEKDYIEFRYEAALDRHGVIDGRPLAAKLIDDAFLCWCRMRRAAGSVRFHCSRVSGTGSYTDWWRRKY